MNITFFPSNLWFCQASWASPTLPRVLHPCCWPDALFSTQSPNFLNKNSILYSPSVFNWAEFHLIKIIYLNELPRKIMNLVHHHALTLVASLFVQHIHWLTFESNLHFDSNVILQCSCLFYSVYPNSQLF